MKRFLKRISELDELNKATLIIFILGIIINIAARVSVPFCDFYRRTVFRAILRVYGGITSLFPFSVGELMIIIAVILVAAAILNGILLVIFRKSTGRVKAFSKKYIKIFLFLVSSVFLVMTLNCFILYHATSFGESELKTDNEYTIEDLEKLRNKIVTQCNELSGRLVRDDAGNIIYEKDVYHESVKCMKALGEKYELLSGFYPGVKTIAFSGFMSQQYVSGVFFPFSMEANVNGVMYLPNYPAVICHELAHIKGYIYEDDANFIGYLATVNSDDIFIKYSGYLSVLYYVDNDYYDAVSLEEGRYEAQPAIEDIVHFDNVFLTQEQWKSVEDSAVISTDVVSQVSDIAMDTSLKVNGVSDGITSYSRVVELLLRYEASKGF